MSSTSGTISAKIVEVTTSPVGKKRHTLWVTIDGHTRQFGINVDRETGFITGHFLPVVVVQTDSKSGKPIKLALA